MAAEGPSIHSRAPEPNPNPNQAHRVLTLALTRPPDWAVVAELGRAAVMAASTHGRQRRMRAALRAGRPRPVGRPDGPATGPPASDTGAHSNSSPPCLVALSSSHFVCSWVTTVTLCSTSSFTAKNGSCIAPHRRQQRGAGLASTTGVAAAVTLHRTSRGWGGSSGRVDLETSWTRVRCLCPCVLVTVACLSGAQASVPC